MEDMAEVWINIEDDSVVVNELIEEAIEDINQVDLSEETNNNDDDDGEEIVIVRKRNIEAEVKKTLIRMQLE